MLLPPLSNLPLTPGQFLSSDESGYDSESFRYSLLKGLLIKDRIFNPPVTPVVC